MPIKAVLFDLDETLILDGPVSRVAFRAAADLGAAEYGGESRGLAEAAGRIASRLWQQGPEYAYCNRIGHSAWEGLWARYDQGDHPAIAALRAWAPGYRMAVWREALQTQDITAEPALLARMAARFASVRRQFPRYPEIDPLLSLLGPHYLLGIVTNGVPDLQREKIAGSGLANVFPASVVSGEIDIGKPDPGIFRFICSELGVQPEECVMVGDNPGRDVAGASAAGMASVWVQRDGRAPDPRHPASLTCTDLLDIVPWLKQLH